VVEAAGRARLVAKLAASAGERVEWSPVLGRAPSIRGRLVGPGLDLSGWYVVAYGDDPEFPNVLDAKVSSDGSFVVRGCADSPHRVQIQSAVSGDVVATRADVRPGDVPLEIPIDPSWVPSCRLRGRFIDEFSRPVRGIEFLLFREGATNARNRAADPEGRFDVGPLPAGRYTLHVRTARYAPFRGEPIEIASGAEWDFGDVRLELGGTIAARLARAPELSGSKIYVVATSIGTSSSELLPESEGIARSPSLAAGEYEVSVNGEPASRVAPYRTRATVRAGEETSIEIPVEVALEIRVQVVPAPAEPLVATVYDAEGRAIWSLAVGSNPWALPKRAARISIPRPAGGPWVGEVSELLAKQGSRWTIDLGE
jgi:hypothetical protein